MILRFLKFFLRATFYKKFINDKKKYNLENLINNTKTSIYDEFCDANSVYWKKENHKNKTEIILIEGFLAESGPNYLIRTGTISKALEEVSGAKPLVLLVNGTTKEPYKEKLYDSFKIDDFIGIYDDIYANFSIWKKLRIEILADIYYMIFKILLKFKAMDTFFGLSFDKVRFGDILYDEIIKESPKNKYTLKKISRKEWHFFKRTFVYFFASEMLYKKYKIKYYVSTHSQYISYGLPLRYFLQKGILSIETTDDILFVYDEDYSNSVPKYHHEINKLLKNNIEEIYNNENMQILAKKELEDRFAGTLDQRDVKLAYCGKQIYTKQILKECLNIQNNNPFVFIFAHIFSDSPQCAGDGFLFADYYVWLYETIKYTSNIPDINWIIKPHPSVKVYNEDGKVAKLIDKFNTVNSSIYLCPDNFSTAGVKDCANVIITAQGTVGLEYSCVGIPTILAGKSFYAGFDFTNEPGTKKQYFEMLKNIKNIKPLNDIQKRTALSVYRGFKNLQNNDFRLIDTIIKNKVWGCDSKPNPLDAYSIMTERLKKNDPKSLHLYNTIVGRIK